MSLSSAPPWEYYNGNVRYDTYLVRDTDDLLLYSVVCSPGCPPFEPAWPFAVIPDPHAVTYRLGINEVGETIWRQETPPFCSCDGTDCRWTRSA